MKIAYITNSGPQSGVGKPASEIAKYIHPTVFSLPATHPKIPKPLQWFGKALRLPKSGFDIWHFTNQTLSFINREPAVVTVFDVIELTEPQRKLSSLVARYLYRGIPRAAHIICVSEYTKKAVQAVYKIPDDRITVIPLAAGERFYPEPSAKQSIGYYEFLNRFNLTEKNKIILYVGSDHPRKNLPVLAKAFAQVKPNIPEAIVIKVGEAGIAAGRIEFLKSLNQLGIAGAVKFYGQANDETLRFLYNIADIFVFPTRFEGFGVSPLESLACGCPVVCSNATSLPEVVGDAALTHDPDDIAGFASSIQRVLTEAGLAQDLRHRGLAQAKKFSWEKSAQKTLAVYRHVLQNFKL